MPCEALRPGQPMEQELQDLLQDKPDGLRELLVLVGAQTCTDVIGIWGSSQELLQEVESEIGSLPPDQEFAVAAFWTVASGRAHSTRAKAQRRVEDHRRSCISTHLVQSGPDSTVPPSGVRIRHLTSTGPGSAAPTMLHDASQDPFAKEVLQKNAKLEAMFELLVADFLDLAELGVDRAMMRDPVRRQLLQETVMPAASRVSPQRAAALVSALRRWRTYALDNQFHVRAPTPLQLSAFFKAVAAGGPTAATSMFHALKWFRQHFALPFELDHWLLQPYKLLPLNHAIQQKQELQPWEMVNLLLRLRQASGTHLLLLAMFVWAATSCIRFEHFQRSSFVGEADTFLIFKCSQGKARRQGTRPPYEWAMPELVFRGASLLKIVKDFVLHEALPDVDFLWPAVALQADELWQVTETTPWIVTKKMSRGRFLELMRGTLMDIGVDPAQAQVAGFNRLRRFLPTLGQICRLDPQDQQSLGSWVEVPSAGGPTPQRKSRATWSMGVHYAGQKVVHSGLLKAALIKRFLQLWELKQPELALTHEGLLPRDSWSWQELAVANERFPPGMESVELPEVSLTPEEGAQPGPPVTDVVKEEPEADNLSPANHADGIMSVSSSTTSSSASDISAAASDLEGIDAPADLGCEGKWFVQASRVHLVQGELDGRLLPFCRDAAYAQDPKQVGEGFNTLPKSALCQRCLARMPRALYKALADTCGWLH